MTPQDNAEFCGGPIEPSNNNAAWGVKWVIEDQINCAPDFKCDPTRGPLEAPRLYWGTYFWSYPYAAPRQYGRFVWIRAAVEADELLD